FVDDVVRRIHFSPSQVQEVIELKPEQLKEQMVLSKPSGSSGDPLGVGYEFESISEWNDKWERVIRVRTPGGRFDMVQRVTYLTPYAMRGVTVGHDWAFSYLTKELNPQMVRKLVQ